MNEQQFNELLDKVLPKMTDEQKAKVLNELTNEWPDALCSLCDDRKVFIPLIASESFVAYAHKNGVSPAGGIEYLADEKNNPMPGVTCKCFYLDNPITKAEALVIADYHHLRAEIEHYMSKGYSPFEALREFDL